MRLWNGGIVNNPVWGSTKEFDALPNNNTYDQGTLDRDRLISISFQYTPNKLIR